MELTYATIPIFGGENRRLYRELQFAYIVTDDKNPTNHPLYVVEKDLVLVCCTLVIIMMLLVYYKLKKKNESNVLGNRKMNFGKCISMDHHPKKVLEKGLF